MEVGLISAPPGCGRLVKSVPGQGARRSSREVGGFGGGSTTDDEFHHRRHEAWVRGQRPGLASNVEHATQRSSLPREPGLALQITIHRFRHEIMVPADQPKRIKNLLATGAGLNSASRPDDAVRSTKDLIDLKGASGVFYAFVSGRRARLVYPRWRAPRERGAFAWSAVAEIADPKVCFDRRSTRCLSCGRRGWPAMD